jgi:hypothetical protein
MPWKAPDVTLQAASFILIPERRAEFLRGKSNMHAWIEGTPVDFQKPDDSWVRVRYNPRKHETFIDLHDRPVYYADYVTIRVHNGKAKTYAKGVKYENPQGDQG